MGAFAAKGADTRTVWHSSHFKAVSFDAQNQSAENQAARVQTLENRCFFCTDLTAIQGQSATDALWLGDVRSAGRLKRMVTFPVGDWFLGVGDGGIGRDKDNPAQGALIMKGSLSDFDEDARPPQLETMTVETEDKAPFAAEGRGRGAGTAEQAPLGKTSDELLAVNFGVKVTRLPRAGFGGELQLLEDFRSQTIRFSDLTDTSRFSCQHAAWGPGLGGPGPMPTLQGYPHPQIELDHPESFASALSKVLTCIDAKSQQVEVHVHLEDRSAGPTPHVLWDAAYDMGGTEVLKSTAPAMWGTRPNMELFCPPKHGPPHWFELTISREANARS
eukprot:g17803.t1